MSREHLLNLSGLLRGEGRESKEQINRELFKKLTLRHPWVVEIVNVIIFI
jgi:hypothetical protein